MMFLVITEAQRLIREAGGEFKAGDKLKNYWFTVCENLSIYADTWAQPRTIERAWREGRMSEQLIVALKKAAEGRKNKEIQQVSDYDAKFIFEIKEAFDAARKDPLFPREEAVMVGAFVSFLVRVAKLRFELAAQGDRAALLRNCCQVSRALFREEADEAAE